VGKYRKEKFFLFITRNPSLGRFNWLRLKLLENFEHSIKIIMREIVLVEFHRFEADSKILWFHKCYDVVLLLMLFIKLRVRLSLHALCSRSILSTWHGLQMIQLAVNSFLIFRYETLGESRRRKILWEESMWSHWSISIIIIVVVIPMLHYVSIRIERLISIIIEIRSKILADINSALTSFVSKWWNKIPIKVCPKHQGIHILTPCHHRTVCSININQFKVIVIIANRILIQIIRSKIIIPIILAIIHRIQCIRVTIWYCIGILIAVIVINYPIKIMVIQGDIIEITVVMMGVWDCWRTSLGVLLGLLRFWRIHIDI